MPERSLSQAVEAGERRGSLGKLSAMFAILLHFLSLECTKSGALDSVLPLGQGSEQVEKAEAASKLHSHLLCHHQESGEENCVRGKCEGVTGIKI